MTAEHRVRIAPDHLSIEKRADGTLVVAVASSGPQAATLPPARFSFREGDPQYAYWMRQYDAQPRHEATPRPPGG